MKKRRRMARRSWSVVAPYMIIWCNAQVIIEPKPRGEIAAQQRRFYDDLIRVGRKGLKA